MRSFQLATALQRGKLSRLVKPVFRSQPNSQPLVDWLKNEVATAEAKLYQLPLPVGLDESVFRAYDIRGIVGKTITEKGVEMIGRAYATEAVRRNQKSVVIGGDARRSTDAFRQALVRGLSQSGLDVVDIGMAPTPVVYYSTIETKIPNAIAITGSHNASEYNGFKFVLEGRPLCGGDIQKLKHSIIRQDFEVADSFTSVRREGVFEPYVRRICQDVQIHRPLRIVVDCGNGVAGLVARQLFEAMGCDVTCLYEQPDGEFPNHHPDPAVEENLQDLIRVTQDEGADIGLAFDGDGDRIGVVTEAGTVIWPDKLLMLFARDILSNGTTTSVVYDVKCSQSLRGVIEQSGGVPVLSKTGHTNIKGVMRETGALLGGEFSGHICFADRWFGFDDAVYCGARLLELLSRSDQTAEELFAPFPNVLATPELHVATTDSDKFRIVKKLVRRGNFATSRISTIDGVRLELQKRLGACAGIKHEPESYVAL